MYNRINTSRTCPNCHVGVVWQSKYLTLDGYLLENVLIDIKPNKRMSGEMHTFCDKCKAAFEITLENGKETEVKPW